jgi:hypothetical protein
VVGEDEFGRKIYGDTRTGKPISELPTANGANPLPVNGSNPNAQTAPRSVFDVVGDAKGNEALERLKNSNDPNHKIMAGELEQLVKGQIPYSPRMFVGPRGEIARSLLGVVDPNYQADTFDQRKKMRANMNSTTPSSMGGFRKFANTGIDHFGRLYDAVEAMPDHSGPVGSYFNKFDYERMSKDPKAYPELAKFNTIAENAGDEIAKAMGVGSESGRAAIKQLLDPSLGKTALKAALTQQIQLLKDKQEEFKNDWNRVMGPNANEVDFYSPEAKNSLKKLGLLNEEGGAAPNPMASNAPPMAGAVKDKQGRWVVKDGSGQWHEVISKGGR